MSSIVRTLSLVTLAILLVCATSKAQDSEAPKFEAGVQFTLLNVNQPAPVSNCCVIIPPGYSNSYWKSGIGGRLTYNFNEFLAAEATVNYFPDSRLFEPTVIRSRESESLEPLSIECDQA